MPINASITRTSGFALIDALIGMSIAAIVCTALISSVYQAQNTTTIARDHLNVSNITLETYEVAVAQSLKDYPGFKAELSSNNCWSQPCHFETDGSTWSIAPSTTLHNGIFSHSFGVSDVYRTPSGDIVVGSGTLDPNTLALTVATNWTGRKSQTKTQVVTTYVHNIDL